MPRLFWLRAFGCVLVLAAGCVGFVAMLADVAGAQETTTTTEAPTTTTTTAPEPAPAESWDPDRELRLGVAFLVFLASASVASTLGRG